MMLRMKKVLGVLLLSLFVVPLAWGDDGAQGEAQDSWSLTYFGTVVYSGFYDTRENVAARDGEEYFFPKPIALNDRGVDLNAVGKLEMKSISTELGVGFKGPKVLGAVPSGNISIDYFALLTELAYMPRIKRAYLQLDWQQQGLRLLAGQYDAVMKVDGFAPKANYTGAGSGFAQTMRMAQLRLSWRPACQFEMAFAAGMHTYHGYSQPRLQQQKSGRPDLGGYLLYEPLPQFAMAASASGRWFKPRATTRSGEVAREQADSYDVALYMRLRGPWVRFVASGSYGKNRAFAKMLGGYGYDPTTDENGDFSYSGLAGGTGWGDIHVTLPANFSLSCFVGYYQQLGADRPYKPLRTFGDGTINPTRGDDVQSLLRVVPEFSYAYKGFVAALSYHFDTALWGAAWDAMHKAAGPLTRSTNHRVQLVLRYGFAGGHTWTKPNK